MVGSTGQHIAATSKGTDRPEHLFSVGLSSRARKQTRLHLGCCYRGLFIIFFDRKVNISGVDLQCSHRHKAFLLSEVIEEFVPNQPDWMQFQSTVLSHTATTV